MRNRSRKKRKKKVERSGTPKKDGEVGVLDAGGSKIPENVREFSILSDSEADTIRFLRHDIAWIGSVVLIIIFMFGGLALAESRWELFGELSPNLARYVGITQDK